MSTDLPEDEADGGRLRRRPARIVRPARRGGARPASARPAPESGALGLDPADLAGALLADLAEVAGQDDPFEFEMLVSSFCGILDVAQAAALTGALPPDVVPLLVGQLESRQDGLSLAVLATLALLAEGETAAAASRAAARLWQAGVLPPDWFEELDRELRVEECLQVYRDLDGSLLVLVGFRRAGRRHAFAVVVRDAEQSSDPDASGYPGHGTAIVQAVAPLPAEVLPERLADLVAEIVPPDELAEIDVEPLDPATARRVLETALRARALRDARLDLEARFAQWDDSSMDANVLGAPPFPTMAAALRNRIEMLPVPPRDASGQQPWAEPDWEDEQDDGLEFDLDLAFPEFPAACGAGVLDGLGAPDFAIPAQDRGTDLPDGFGAPEFDSSRGGGPASPVSAAADAARPRRAARGVPGLPARRGPQEGPAPVYRLRIDLKGAKPPIWRRIEVPGDLSLAALHEAIQAVFEWEGYHLHVFETSYGDFGDAQVDLGHGLEHEVTVEQVLAGAGAKLTYVYDYGDYWEHVVRVERTEPARAEPRIVCTGGRRAAPPEDCGGLWEYQESLRKHGDAGADVCDLPELNRRLAEHREGGGWAGRWDGFRWGPDTPS